MNVNMVLSDLATSFVLLKLLKEEWKYVIMVYGQVFVLTHIYIGEEDKQDLYVSNFWDMHLKVTVHILHRNKKKITRIYFVSVCSNKVLTFDMFCLCNMFYQPNWTIEY